MLSIGYVAPVYFLLFKPPTYVYLVPTPNLIDAERRAFFVEESGPENLQNVEILLWDNKGNVGHTERYAEIDAGPQNPLSPRYFWWKPSTPWDEDYTITITARGRSIVQNLIVRSTKSTLQFATQVNLSTKWRPVMLCRDPLLPGSYALARRASSQCDKFMTLPQDIQSKLQPPPYILALPNGDALMVRLRTLPPPSELESQSESRHLWEYQSEIIRSSIEKYRGARLLILSTRGQNTWRYAKEFREVFI